MTFDQNQERTGMYDLTDPVEAKAAADAAIIAQQNDRFRNTWGADFTIPGQVVFTAALAEAGFATTAAAMAGVQQFADFNDDNDPYGDHSFGAVEIKVGDETKTVWFKIDLYDKAYEYGSEQPTDVGQTRRVMTVMFPSDY